MTKANIITEKPPTSIEWRDLATTRPYQFLIELSLAFPWLILSWWLYAGKLWLLGPIASFMFFLCCLRLNHEAMHNNLGLSRRWDSVILHGLSAIMLGSNHADTFCHLQHHKSPLSDDDHEGHCAHMSFWQVIAYGPRFPIELNRAAWANGSQFWRRRIAIDWIAVALFILLCLWLEQTFLLFHLGAMLCGQCTVAFFAVWITHQGTEHSGIAGRSQRGTFAWIAYHMFYHREHHLFPKVPVSNLPKLARRLDQDVEGYREASLPVIGSKRK